jgi:hypothetical protein
MNLLAQQIDRLAQIPALRAFDPAKIARSFAPRARNAIFTTAWAALFVAMTMHHDVGDTHPGQYLPFWQNACRAGSTRACNYRANLTRIYCERGSGWACNEIAILSGPGQFAKDAFKRACDLGFSPGCENSNQLRMGSGPMQPARTPPQVRDLPVVLSGTKPTLRERDPAKLYALACTQGWPDVCAAQAANQQ